MTGSKRIKEGLIGASKQLIARTLASVLILVGVTLSGGLLEVCSHADGHAHFYLPIQPCPGILHAGSDPTSPHHTQAHTHGHHHHHNDEPHEPCDHEALISEKEWLAFSPLSVHSPSSSDWVVPHLQGSTVEVVYGLFQVPLADSARGPPGLNSGGRVFLRTTRLLI